VLYLGLSGPVADPVGSLYFGPKFFWYFVSPHKLGPILLFLSLVSSVALSKALRFRLPLTRDFASDRAPERDCARTPRRSRCSPPAAQASRDPVWRPLRRPAHPHRHSGSPGLLPAPTACGPRARVRSTPDGGPRTTHGRQPGTRALGPLRQRAQAALQRQRPRPTGHNQSG